ncbi:MULTISPECIES: mandelate racemase/muconate lactonizing enzyme family protein [unclassified Chelatococcus]|uniref:mandelate racemase/muconate lactonizing enzyme family protein n=1 Tax=unclassified Chelatococcus TaxID=2638111 RepID=UPI00224BBB61|nr:mandelate racemase/muconate lactonizing enzyme family protein [Chelatococcus sp.]MCO5075828.1 mandelate racemase/muconate lactonizing enzyme family protein [Chelatococcus sp.]CAH1649689.1 L-alanine-DL-glutamate epimerase-like enolase superfamily enzyme [Hyphomicrobiales bacterium]CAH1667049.1 L-alanine-DL-glutamate epimerase-like enolase superfamily enzyme [Hyphomicrobiales bacterium]
MTTIDAVDFFYLSMPEVTDEADGSQDALLVRVVAGGHVGWGECEAAPLPSIAAFICPMSHGVCRPVAFSVLGKRLESPADIARISVDVAYNSMDLLQAPHTLSGVEMALWDALGKMRGQPVWRMLGYDTGYAKTPYASVLFGDTAQETLERARDARARNFRAAKFGWGPIGRGSVEADAEHFAAAREGLGPDGLLLVDTGQIFLEDVERAAARLPAMEQAGVLWFEEPFQASAIDAYAALARKGSKVRLAGGEGAHNVHMAKQLIDHGGVGYVQIDCGRIGGIGPSKEIADHAVAKGVTFVNHTFTSHLALSASIQAYAGLKDHMIAEYPAMPKPLALAFTANHIERDANGEIHAPDAPGLGIDVSAEGARPYLQDVEIKVNGKVLYATPAF